MHYLKSVNSADVVARGDDRAGGALLACLARGVRTAFAEAA